IKVALDEIVAKGKEATFKCDVDADVYADFTMPRQKCAVSNGQRLEVLILIYDNHVPSHLEMPFFLTLEQSVTGKMWISLSGWSPEGNVYWDNLVLYWDSLVLYWDSLVLYWDSLVLYWDSLVLYWDSLVLYWDSLVLYWDSLVLYWDSLRQFWDNLENASQLGTLFWVAGDLGQSFSMVWSVQAGQMEGWFADEGTDHAIVRA
ncbi:hypothetical protein EV401DRAFT_1896366, partial [Pisolithus croceorrhizus]